MEKKPGAMVFCRFLPRPGKKDAETMQTANAHVAQSVERVLGKDEVTSSTLVMGSSLVDE